MSTGVSEPNCRPGWPYTNHPSGWFQIGWSEEIAPGQVVPVRAFDVDLVMFRTAESELHLLDAVCPHLGAHLGYGGTVIDGSLSCPFHGWRWGPSGENTCIPYSSRVNRAVRLRRWDVREVDGLILAWHDAGGGAPTWQPAAIASVLPEFNADEFQPLFPHGTQLWPDVLVYPQFVAENTVDSAHFRYVHSARSVSRIVDFGHSGHVFESFHEFESTRGASLRMRLSGLGVLLGAFSLDGRISHIEIQATTPTTGPRSDLRGSVWVRCEVSAARGIITPRMQKVINYQHDELGRDIPIWERLRYQPRPPLVPEEARPYRALRQWAAQFYPVERPEEATVASPDVPARDETGE
jgi:nitrite reductase/ring-hydroxylating ferredoxin subunit